MKQWLWRALAGLGVCLLLVLGRVEAGSGADDHLGVACWGWSVDVRGGPALASPAAAPAKNRGPRQARAAAPESLGVDCVLLTERGVGPPWLDSRGPPGSAGGPGSTAATGKTGSPRQGGSVDPNPCRRIPRSQEGGFATAFSLVLRMYCSPRSALACLFKADIQQSVGVGMMRSFADLQRML